MTRKVVFLSFESPLESNSGAKIRDLQNLRLLGEQHSIEALTFGEHEARVPVPGIASAHLTTIRRTRRSLVFRAFYPLRPYVVNGYCKAIERKLRSLYSPGSVLWVSRLSMAQYIPAAKRMGYAIYFDEHNVESHLWLDDVIKGFSQSAVGLPARLHQYWIANQCRRFERAFVELSDHVIVTSDIDLSRLKRLSPRTHPTVIPNCVDVDGYRSVRERVRAGTTLLFTGTLHYGPNVEGLFWFTQHVMPRLRAQYPQGLPYRIVVAGSNPNAALIAELAKHGIELVANPPTMLPLLEEAAAIFVPLRSGGGTRLKILEAMACELPIISTGKGAEGLLFSPSRDLEVADQPDHFAQAIKHLMADAKARGAMGKAGYEVVRNRYDWRSVRDKIRGLFADSAPKGPAA